MNLKTILSLLLFFSLAACSSDKKDQPKDQPKDQSKDGETHIVKVFNYKRLHISSADFYLALDVADS